MASENHPQRVAKSGTIGGYLAEMLAKAGAGTVGGKLTLVDMARSSLATLDAIASVLAR